MKNYHLKKQSGFTLIELLVTLAIIGILTSVGVPSYNKFSQQGEFSEAYNGIYNAYRFARSEAIKTSSPMKLQSYNTYWIVIAEGTAYADRLATTSSIDGNNIAIIGAPGSPIISGNGSLANNFSISVRDRRNGSQKFVCILKNGQSYKSDSGCS